MRHSVGFKSSVSVLAVIMGAGLAHAADNKASNPFEGGYIGIQGGFLDSDVKSVSEFQDTEAGVNFYTDSFNSSVKPNGIRIGGELGYNHIYSNSVLFGAEVIGSFLTAEKASNETLSTSFTSATSLQSKIGAMVIGQAKLGYASPNYAVYGTIGIVGADIEQSASFDVNAQPVSLSASKFGMGYTLGAGADLMVAKNVSVGVSYTYGRLNTLNWNSSTSGDASSPFGYAANLGSSNVDFQLIGAKVDFHF